MFDLAYYQNKKQKREVKFQALKDRVLQSYLNITLQMNTLSQEINIEQADYLNEIEEIDKIIKENTQMNEESTENVVVGSPETPAADQAPSQPAPEADPDYVDQPSV